MPGGGSGSSRGTEAVGNQVVERLVQRLSGPVLMTAAEFTTTATL